MATTLVIRLSSLGDVAILIPVLYSVARKYPGERFLLLTKKGFRNLFFTAPANIEVIPVDVGGQHKGIAGYRRLLSELTRHNIDKVADFHDVLRSKGIDLTFRLRNKEVAAIDKGRSEKKELTRRNNKLFRPLKTSAERYKEVFRKLGYEVESTFESLFTYGGEVETETISPKNPDESWIGIAPFAKHLGKTYPADKMKQVISSLNSRPDTKIFLFGGKEDKEKLEKWEQEFSRVESLACKVSLQQELTIISRLDLMVSMDSANMHLASLVNTPVVSIWGATHPYTGFYGYRQDPENIVQIELSCRPCSVFGKEPCYRNDYACMNRIEPEMVLSAVSRALGEIHE